MPGTTASCQCGFVWNEGTDMPAPNIVRSAVGQPSAVEQLSSTDSPGGQALLEEENMEMELPPFPWEKKSRDTASPQPAPPAPGIVETSDTPTRTPEVKKMSPTVPVTRNSTPVRPNAALLMTCPTCDANISRRAASCPKCKSAPYSHCLICATRLLVNSATCSECGDPDPFTAPAGGGA
jgi:hypothetical protein